MLAQPDHLFTTALADTGDTAERPKLANPVHNLIDEGGNAGIYRLRLGEDGETIGWMARGTDGEERAATAESDHDWPRRLKVWLIGPLAAEALL